MYLEKANYAHPEWPVEAAPLLLDVHGGIGIGAIDPPRTLQLHDNRLSQRRFMYYANDTSIPASIRGITSYGITVDQPSATFVREVFIPRKLRGAGLGRHLMELIEEESRREGKIKLFLESLPDTVDFYRKLGFTQKERSDNRRIMEKLFS